MCLRVLKESNKSKVDSYSAARNSVLIISHITFRDCHVHIFSDNLSCNSCIYSFSSKDRHLYIHIPYTRFISDTRPAYCKDQQDRCRTVW